MFLNALLEASAKTTNIVKWVSVGAIVVLFGVIAVICIKGKKRYDAKHIAFAGISLSLSFVLSLIKVSPVTYGGSITLKFRSLTHLHLRLRTRRRFAYGAHLRVI